MLLPRKTLLSKMSHSGRLKLLILLVLISSISALSTFPFDAALCPIGFIAKDVENAGSGCLQIKSHESFDKKYFRCSGNEMPIDFFNSKNDYATSIGKEMFWTDYVRAYEHGPFINWLIGDKDMGRPYMKEIQKGDDIDGSDMCSVVSLTSKKLTSVKCDGSYSRYCFVKNYRDAAPVLWDCPQGYVSFASPVSACISTSKERYRKIRKAPFRASKDYADSYCKKNNSHLLHRGYIYTNHAEFSISNENNWEIPLGITKNEENFLWTDHQEIIPPDEWNFDNPLNLSSHYQHVSLQNQTWKLKEGNELYFNVLCEHFVKPPLLELKLSKVGDHLYVRSSNVNVSLFDITCFTDSVGYYPTKVKVSGTRNPGYFEITPVADGYYWCLTINTIEYTSEESEKLLYLRSELALNNLVAIKIQFHVGAVSDKTDIKFIENELNDFFNQTVVYSGETIVSTPRNNLRLKVKRMYEDQILLLHGYLNTYSMYEMYRWTNFNVLYVRKVFKCDTIVKNVIYHRNIGEGLESPDGCSYSYCKGDFNNGAHWVTEWTNDCETSTIDSTIPFTITSEIPTTTELSTTTICPQCEIQNVVDSLANILNNSQTLNSTDLTDATGLINGILELDRDVDIPPQVLQNLDAIVEKVELKNESHVKIVDHNIAVVLASRNANDPIMGIRVMRQGDGLSDENIHVLKESDVNRSSETNENDIFIIIPPGLGVNNVGSKLSFVVFRNDRAFSMNSSHNMQRVNSRVISVSLTNTTNFEDGQVIDIHLRPYENHQFNESKLCAFWDFKSGSNGNWSTEGCELLINRGPNGMDTCRCKHLTHFAEIIRYNNNKDIGYINEITLSIISLVGCIVSLLGLLIIGLTGILFKTWRNDFSNKVWMHLSVSITILIVTFLIIALVDFKINNTIFCVAVGVTLHYSVLCSFCWMLISAVLSYKRLVTVFAKNSSHRLLKACAFGWLLPILPIGILFALDPDNYIKQFKMGPIEKDFCFPSGLGFWLTVFLPIALVILANTVLFIIIIYSVFLSSKIQRHGDTKQIFRSVTVSFLLFFLFGLTWVFGLFAENIIMAYLFCLTATIQGLVLFIFFVVGNKKTRDLWCVHLRIKEKKKLPVTTSTSRSYPSRGNSNNSRSVTLRKFDEGCNTKPRSLSGNMDNMDSRFS